MCVLYGASQALTPTQLSKASDGLGIRSADDAEVLASTRQRYLDAFAALASRDFGEPIDARDKRGWTPLTYVCRHATALGDEFISAVLDAGADVDHPCARGTPALVHAAAADSAAAAAALSREAPTSRRATPRDGPPPWSPRLEIPPMFAYKPC